jgi:hypothetical protein
MKTAEAPSTISAIEPITSIDLARESIASTLDWFFESLDKDAATVRLMCVVFEQRQAAEVELIDRLKRFCVIGARE